MNKPGRISFLQREIAHYENPPSYVDAGWAAKCLTEATAELARLTYTAPPPTDDELTEQTRFGRLYRAGFRSE